MDKDSLKEELDYIITNRQIKTYFQPLISLYDGKVLGYEALSRITCASEIKNTDTLFNVAWKHNRLWELELLCRNKAFEAAANFRDLENKAKLFLNVSPNVMHDESFKKGLTKEFLREYGMTAQDIIFEITEKNVIWDMQGFRLTIDHYKGQNYKIAVDDAGAGYSGLNLISDIAPNYIKLDMKLVRNVNSEMLKTALVKGMVELSRAANIDIIAEGIETKAELDTLIALGVQYGQGYFIQRPNPQIKPIRQEIVLLVKEANLKKEHIAGAGVNNIHIENICSRTDMINPQEMVANIYDLFKNNVGLFGVCVIEKERPVGIITRENLAYQLSGHYGFTLKQNKPASHIMDKSFLAVDCSMSISEVSAMAMSRSQDKLYDFIVVTQNGKYIGTVTIKDLLIKTTEIEVAKAKHQNPLSGLPANLIIEQKIAQAIKNGNPYTVAYLDIDNFKAYNDVYGFENGDMVIKLLADILKENFESNSFIGHVGGDDFVLILPEHVEEENINEAVKEFEMEVLKFYSKADIQKGYIISLNRRGQAESFPLISLTSVTVSNKERIFKNEFELAEILAEKKKQAKQSKYLACSGLQIVNR